MSGFMVVTWSGPDKPNMAANTPLLHLLEDPRMMGRAMAPRGPEAGLTRKSIVLVYIYSKAPDGVSLLEGV